MKNTYVMKSLLAAVGLSVAAAAMAATPADGALEVAAPATAATGKVLVFGQSVPLTGSSKDLGIKMQAGAKAYFDSVNKQGGVNGAKIELRTKDDGYDPERAKKNTEQFVTENVFALFGYVGTATSNASRPVFEQAQVPFLFAFTGTGALRAPFSPLIFNLRASYGQETERMVDHLSGFGINKIAIFYQNDAYGLAGLAGAKAAMDRRNLPLLVEGTVERNSVEVATAVKSISDRNPQAIIMVSTYEATAAFVRGYKASGKALPQLLNVSFVGTAALQEALDKDAEGVIVAEVVPPFSDKSLATVREFNQVMKEAKQEKLIDYTSFEGFLAAKVAVEGLRKSGANPSREAFIKGLEQVRNYNIGDVFINFDDKRHSGSDYVDLIMLKNNGSIVY